MAYVQFDNGFLFLRRYKSSYFLNQIIREEVIFRILKLTQSLLINLIEIKFYFFLFTLNVLF